MATQLLRRSQSWKPNSMQTTLESARMSRLKDKHLAQMVAAEATIPDEDKDTSEAIPAKKGRKITNEDKEEK